MSGRTAADIVAAAPMGPLQWRVLALCTLIAVVDGFDVSAMAVATPSVAEEFGEEVGRFGPALSASIAGLALGGILGGPAGDRFGRRPTLLVMFLLGVAATAATALSTTIPMLVVFRFLTGLGLGGTIPLGAALTAEYLPTRRRGALLTLMFAGHPVGGALANFVAPALIRSEGWQAIFYVGGLLPLAVCALLWAILPESPGFLQKARRAAELERVLRRVDPSFSGTLQEPAAAPQAEVAPLRRLFGPEMRATTLLLWAVFFGTQFTLFLMASWLPALFKQTGLSLADALYGSMAFQLGGVIGTLGFGALTDRFDPKRVIALMYVLGAATILILAQATGASVLLYAAALGAGVGAIGSQLCLNSFTTILYPTEMRATGVGWALSFGRLGAITGPLLVGFMLVADFTPRDILRAAAVVPIVCAAAILFLRTRRQPAQEGASDLGLVH